MTSASARVVAYLGGHGSFSEEACRRFVPAHDLMPLQDFASVAQAVCQGSADLAVLPLSNSRVGPIAVVHQLLSHPELRVVGEEMLGVRLNLLGVPGSIMADVTRVLSHPAALKQCARYLDGKSWVQSAVESTAAAAQQVARAGDRSSAAIASSAAGAIHGLEIMAHDIQGSAENVTRFAIIERRDQFA